MENNRLIAHLFRTEFRKLVSVLTSAFGLEHIQTAEDLVSDTFLLATETWGKKGLPDNPTAWLYTVAKNKTRDYLRRNSIFREKVSPHVLQQIDQHETSEFNMSIENIRDSELRMLFAICHPSIPSEAQAGLALRVLFGLGIEEIAETFLTNKETINKRLHRAREKLRLEAIQMELPSEDEIEKRLSTVLLSIYLLFNLGYYSASHKNTLRGDICFEALQLAYLLSEYKATDKPALNALIALMCFHASRFEARFKEDQILLINEQDASLWDKELIAVGEWYLNKASTGDLLSKYHLEAAIAYWHTRPIDSDEKWEQILRYYNLLLQIEYSPIAALNRTYALYKTGNEKKAIEEALKLNLKENHLYYVLLGYLHHKTDRKAEREYYLRGLELARTDRDKRIIQDKLNRFNE